MGGRQGGRRGGGSGAPIHSANRREWPSKARAPGDASVQANTTPPPPPHRAAPHPHQDLLPVGHPGHSRAARASFSTRPAGVMRDRPGTLEAAGLRWYETDRNCLILIWCPAMATSPPIPHSPLPHTRRLSPVPPPPLSSHLHGLTPALVLDESNSLPLLPLNTADTLPASPAHLPPAATMTAGRLGAVCVLGTGICHAAPANFSALPQLSRGLCNLRETRCYCYQLPPGRAGNIPVGAPTCPPWISPPTPSTLPSPLSPQTHSPGLALLVCRSPG